MYVSCALQGADAVQTTLEQIDLVKRMVAVYPDTFAVALSSADVRTAFKQGKIASLMGMEGGHSMHNSLGALRGLFDAGARYMTLTHSCNTAWAQSSAGPTMDPPLTAFGVEVVHEMNRLGMIVDMSHIAHTTMRKVLDVTKAPVIFSHSSVFSICKNQRNVPDDVIQRIPANGGVIMVNFWPSFVSCSSNATLSQVADHIEYLRNSVGADYIGYGSDFDGIPTVPKGLEDVSKYVELTAELVRRRFTDLEIAAIVGGNVLRVMERVEEVAKELQSKEVPSDAHP